MSGMQKFWDGLACLLLVTDIACSQQPCITNITHPSSNVVSLDWTSTTNLNIVAQCSDLTTGRFQYVGSVLSTNQALLTNGSAVSFFRVRNVAAIDFPDPILRTAVSNAIVTWYEPRTLIYDIDLQGITSLSCSWAGIADASG